jgi:hypothetical protein
MPYTDPFLRGHCLGADDYSAPWRGETIPYEVAKVEFPLLPGVGRLGPSIDHLGCGRLAEHPETEVSAQGEEHIRQEGDAPNKQ